jgi:cation:H+ antiporter
MSMITLVLFLLGLVALVVGAEALVKGASRLAAAVGVSPLVIGLTVVSFGTSAPELAVSLQAAIAGNADIAIGNVVGSNIFNVLFILGVSALIVPLVVHQQLVQFDVPLMIAASILLWLLSLDGVIGRVDGLVLFSGIIGYTAMTVVLGKKTRQQDDEQPESPSPQDHTLGPDGDALAVPSAGGSLAMNLGLIAVGLVLLILGSRWLVDGAVELATALGLSPLVIGLTIVAAGTSLPEVATSVMAAIRGQRDIAVGNVVGSNIFNILGILGLTAVIAPGGVPVNPESQALDMPFMVAVAISCLPIFFTGHLIARWEGLLFLAYYVAYTVYLLLAASKHEALESYATVLFLLVTPLVAVTLVIGVVRAIKDRRYPTSTAP